jgi:hypothetical protein
MKGVLAAEHQRKASKRKVKSIIFISGQYFSSFIPFFPEMATCCFAQLVFESRTDNINFTYTDTMWLG